MPGFTTHYIMGMKAFNDFRPSSLKLIIAKYRYIYQLGLQGPDIFFYNLPLVRHRNHKNVGMYMHESHVNKFFENYLKRIGDLSSKRQKEMAEAYFAGAMCHYIGDSVCHPYVYGRIGHDPKLRSGKQRDTQALHASLENDIDAILLYKYKKKRPSQFNQAATISLSGLETQFISRFLSNVINDTYYSPLVPSSKTNYKVTQQMVSRSIWAMRIGCRVISDPEEKKKRKINFFERHVLKHPVISSKLVTDVISDMKWALNSAHETWINPWDNAYASQMSFPELFMRSLAKCSDCYYLFNELTEKKLPWTREDMSPLLSALGNFSYHSGLDVG